MPASCKILITKLALKEARDYRQTQKQQAEKGNQERGKVNKTNKQQKTAKVPAVIQFGHGFQVLCYDFSCNTGTTMHLASDEYICMIANLSFLFYTSQPFVAFSNILLSRRMLAGANPRSICRTSRLDEDIGFGFGYLQPRRCIWEYALQDQHPQHYNNRGRCCTHNGVKLLVSAVVSTVQRKGVTVTQAVLLQYHIGFLK